MVMTMNMMVAVVKTLMRMVGDGDDQEDDGGGGADHDDYGSSGGDLD